jgi:hypothetical protein
MVEFDTTAWPRMIYGTAWKGDATLDLVSQALEKGFRAFDTAGQPTHYREDLCGKALAAATEGSGLARSTLWIQTKFTPATPYDSDVAISTHVNESVNQSLSYLQNQTTDEPCTAKDVSFGAGVAWREQYAWKTKASSLGNYTTTTDAALFAIGMAAKNLISVLSRADHSFAEVVTESRIGLTAVESNGRWALPVIAGIKRQTQRIEDAGGRAILTWLPDGKEVEGYKIARGAAQRAAKQQPKEMRSASLSYVKQAIKERWKPTTKIDKHIRDAKKSIAARYLQLKSGHAITGAHLLRIGKVQNAQCWWCGGNSQTVSHLLLECRKWRRQRDSMLRKLCARKVSVSERRDKADLKILFSDEATADVLRFIDNTEVGKKLAEERFSDDTWDIERLDRSADEGEVTLEGGGEQGGG